jgi:hypothetical protein
MYIYICAYIYSIYICIFIYSYKPKREVEKVKNLRESICERAHIYAYIYREREREREGGRERRLRALEKVSVRELIYTLIYRERERGRERERERDKAKSLRESICERAHIYAHIKYIYIYTERGGEREG